MVKIFKISALFCGVVLLIGFLTFSPGSQPNPGPEPVLAQQDMSPEDFQQDEGGAVCDEVIPIGGALVGARELLDGVYTEYQNAQAYMENAIDTLVTELAKLNKNQGEVCDWLKCKAQVVNKGPEFAVEVDAWIKSFEVGGQVPLCKEYLGVGDPCPSLKEAIKGLEGAKNAFQTAHQNVKDKFDPQKSNIVVTYDLAEIDETTGQSDLGEPITLAERIMKELRAIDTWLTPSVTGKMSCAPSELYQRQVAAKEKGRIFPEPCRRAIESRRYWPKPWSEACEAECKGEATPRCFECLGSQAPEPTSSFLAQVNYKIYGICKDECKQELEQEELSPQCEACLCQDLAGNALSEEACQDWFCGGYRENWLCCHELPLEK